MKLLQTLLAGTALVMAGGAVAQTMPQDAAPQEMAPSQDAATTTTEAPADAAMPADPATEATAQDASFTDAEIQGFATAALKIQEMDADPATATDPAMKTEKVAEVVTQSGIDIDTFNAIAAAMQSNPEVAERVQVAAREIQKSSG